MYRANAEFDPKSPEAKAVQRGLNVLAEIFPDKTPELERFNVISMYCVVAELLRQYVCEQVKPLLRSWFLAFRGSTQRSGIQIGG